MESINLKQHLQQLTTEAVHHIVKMNYGAKRAEREIRLRHGIFPYL